MGTIDQFSSYKIKEESDVSVRNVRYIYHRQSLLQARHHRDEKVTMAPVDRKKIALIAVCCMLQCVALFVWALTILKCVWSPDIINTEFVKIGMVMYLYDYKKCGVDLERGKGVVTYDLSLLVNETKPENTKAIKFSGLPKSTSTRLTSTTRKYIEISIALHVLWLLTAIFATICSQINHLNFKILKLVVSIFMYTCFMMVFFDLSMAIVYIAHIQQSLTRSMVLRYAGWAIQMKIQHPDNFAGWIPMIASFVWLRGVIIWLMNIFSIKTIWFIRKKIKRREIIIKVSKHKNAPIPDNLYPIYKAGDEVLVYHP